MMRLQEYSHPDINDRNARARHRQIAQRKRERTPFVKDLEETTEPSPVHAVERAYHALVAPNWTTDPTHAEPLLLPIELFVVSPDKTMHMFTQWDVNERHLSPELVADRIRRARAFPKEFVKPAAMQIRRALFAAGIICAAPPLPPGPSEENRRLIRIDIQLGDGTDTRQLRDEFEWDLGIGSLNSPELFAHCLCSDAGIPQKHASAVAKAIREKLVYAHAIVYGDEETKRLALSTLPDDDPLRDALPKVYSVFSRDLEQNGAPREANEVEIADMYIAPLVDAVVTESERRAEDRRHRMEEDSMRKESEVARAAEQAEAEERQAKIEKAIEEVEQAAIALQQERGLDFRPYLALKIARGERLGTWTPAVFDRKRRRQTSFPMTAVSRSHAAFIPAGPRSARRRRSNRREGGPESHRDRRSEGHSQMSDSTKKPLKRPGSVVETETKEEAKRVVINGKDMRVRVRLRVKPEQTLVEGRGGSNPKKRRRR